MTDPQADVRRMFGTILKLGIDNPTIVSTRPGLVTSLGLLNDQCVLFDAAAGIQGVDITGTTTDRKTLYNNLVTSVYHITSGTSAYAGFIRDYTLKNKVNKSESDTQDLGFDHIADYTTSMLAIINPLVIATTLNDWGVLAIDTADTLSKLIAFTGNIAVPRNAVAIKKAETETLPPILTEGRRILKEICDPVVVTLRATQPTFFKQYKVDRKIIHTGTGTTIIEVHVKNAAGDNLYNADVNFPLHHIEFYTDLDGTGRQTHVHHDTFADGIVKLIGHKDYTIPPFLLKQGKTARIEVILQPA